MILLPHDYQVELKQSSPAISLVAVAMLMNGIHTFIPTVELIEVKSMISPSKCGDLHQLYRKMDAIL